MTTLSSNKKKNAYWNKNGTAEDFLAGDNKDVLKLEQVPG